MKRLLCPGGGISSGRLRAVAKALTGEGDGFADVTTRGDLLLEIPEAGFAVLPAASGGEGSSGPEPAFTGVYEQEPGFFRVGVPLAAGRITARQLAKAADLAERYGEAVVRFTWGQGLLFLKVPQEKVVNLLEGLQSVDLKPQGSMVRRGLTVCSETDDCLEGWPVVSRRAREIVEHLESQVLLTDPVGIRVSGPSCACGGAAAEEISVAGAHHVDLRVKGRLLASGVPADELKFLLERLLVAWKRRREPGESLGAFCGRVGHEQVSHFLKEAEAA